MNSSSLINRSPSVSSSSIILATASSMSNGMSPNLMLTISSFSSS